MVDSYMWGKVERISPEAPVPIISVSKRENRPGGAANVAINIKAMGANPIICSVIGEDDNASTFVEILKQNNIQDIGIIRSKNRITTTKTRIIGHHQHLIRIDEEHDKELTKKDETLFFEHIKNIIDKNKIDAIIFEDYDKGVITHYIINSVIELANQKNILVAVDPKKKNFNSYKNVDLFKPNFKEFVEGTKLDINKDEIEKLFQASFMLQNKNNIKILLTTLSERGIFICDNKGCHNIPAEIRDISDVSGAGDTVISVAALCLVAGLDTYSIAMISNLAGGLVCEKLGVVPIDKQQLLDECIINKNLVL